MLLKFTFFFGMFFLQIVPANPAGNYNLDYASGVFIVAAVTGSLLLSYYIIYMIARRKIILQPPRLNQKLKASVMIWIILSALGFASTVGLTFYSKFMVDQGSNEKDDFHTVRIRLRRRGLDDKVLYFSPAAVPERDLILNLMLTSGLLSVLTFYLLQRALAKQEAAGGLEHYFDTAQK